MQTWTSASPYLDPGPHKAALAAMGQDVEGAVEAVQGLLIHGGAFAHYGLPSRPYGRETLAAKARLDMILATDARPLAVARSPADRAAVTCRDYALLLCAALRQQGRAARVRCGFAAYLGGAPWEDHWICELEDGARWLRLDAQLDAPHRLAVGIDFPPLDMPSSAFLTADEAWRAVRAGEIAPDHLAHGAEAGGLWFAYVNLIRDRLALADRLTSDWDRWREAAAGSPVLDIETLARADGLASQAPDAPPPDLRPWWIAA